MGKKRHSRPFPLSLSRRYSRYFEFIRGRCAFFPIVVSDPAAHPEPFLPPALRNERGASGLHQPDDRFVRGMSAGDLRRVLRVVRRDPRVGRDFDPQAVGRDRDRPLDRKSVV